MITSRDCAARISGFRFSQTSEQRYPHKRASSPLFRATPYPTLNQPERAQRSLGIVSGSRPNLAGPPRHAVLPERMGDRKNPSDHRRTREPKARGGRSDTHPIASLRTVEESVQVREEK